MVLRDTGGFLPHIPATLGSAWLEVLVPKGCKVLPRRSNKNPIELYATVDTWALRLFVPRDQLERSYNLGGNNGL